MRRLPSLLLLLIAVRFAFAQSQNQDAAAYAAADDMFQLTSASPSVSRPLLVDRAPLLSVSVVAASMTLTVTLTSPSGTRFTFGEPNSAAGFQSQVIQTSNGSTVGAAYAATLANPATGTWTLTVAEKNALPAPLDIVVTAGFNNATRIALLGGGETFPAGSGVRMAVVVFDGTKKVAGLTITAAVRGISSGSFAPVSVTFRDDGTGGDERAGDAVYEAFATAVSPAAFQPGTYVLHVDASGTASTGAFRRSAAAQFRIASRDAQISGFTDFGEDDDFDGFLDRVIISSRAAIATAGIYRVSIRLRASNNREVQHSGEDSFAAGSSGPIDISFPAKELRDLGVNGPYSVAEVRYDHVSNTDVVPADIRYDLGKTADYDLSELQHPAISLTGQGSASGVDTNKNGLFDVLQVDLGVAAEVDGRYDVSVTLMDRDNHEIGFANGTIDLTFGTNSLRITFDGRRIGANGVDGPYTLANLIAFGADQSLIATTAFVTPAFHASSFEGYHVPRLRPARHK